MPKLTEPIVEGINGYKMPESMAFSIDKALKTHSKDSALQYKRKASMPETFTLDEGSRTDISLVTTEAVDRDNEVVLIKGLNLDEFRANPVVPFAHKYDELPVGSAIWIKPNNSGLLAKTYYSKKPKDWQGPWLPDAVFSMVSDPNYPTCRGKSIGFLPENIRYATKEEISRRPELKDVSVIDKATLWEFSIAPIPANSEALVQMVSKCTDKNLTKIIEDVYKIKAVKNNICICGNVLKSLPHNLHCEKCNKNYLMIDGIQTLVPSNGYLKLSEYQKSIKTSINIDINKKIEEKILDELHRLLGSA